MVPSRSHEPVPQKQAPSEGRESGGRPAFLREALPESVFGFPAPRGRPYLLACGLVTPTSASVATFPAL